jgi:hypothetical protein
MLNKSVLICLVFIRAKISSYHLLVPNAKICLRCKSSLQSFDDLLLTTCIVTTRIVTTASTDDRFY